MVINVKGNSKDDIQAKQDLGLCYNRPGLLIDESSGDKCSKPVACYSLTKEQKKIVFDWVKELKFPHGYTSNLAKYVNYKDIKMTGMKSHSCHVFMEQLMTITFREFLSTNRWSCLAKLSLFYIHHHLSWHYYKSNMPNFIV